MNLLIEKLKASCTQSVINDLNPAVTKKDIETLESFIGLELPVDFKAYLESHNGQKGNAQGLFNGLQALSTQQIQKEWHIWKELLDAGEFDNEIVECSPEIQNSWWNQAWIPITANGCGDNICIDMSPTELGKKGQIIEIWHDDDSRKILANSFTEWLKSLM